MSQKNSNCLVQSGTLSEEQISLGTNRSPDALIREWEQLCLLHLPLGSKDSVWRFSRGRVADDPTQGWKLHVSATVLTAGEVLSRIAPYLRACNVMFKAPGSLAEVSHLNCGLYYGYSQVGKFITVYPKSAAQALTVARRLHQLTRGMPAPCVPFDQRYRPDSCVFYRFGAFSSLTIEQPEGTRVPAIRDPGGSLVPDRRAPGAAIPAWVTDPFPPKRGSRRRLPKTTSPLGTSIFAYKAFSQRGKGGVYKALDFSKQPARLCILKEGRKHGETAWDGRDGYWRVRHEAQVLNSLTRAGVEVPAVYTSFKSDANYYLVTELISGSNLQQILSKESAPLPSRTALRYGLQLSDVLARIHRAGWVWRDCKPSNLMISPDGVMHPVDFEGAHPIDQRDPVPWGTLGYVPPEWQTRTPSNSGPAQDLYALGAVLHQLFCGKVPDPPGNVVRCLDLPPNLSSLISSLLDPLPEARPKAYTVTNVLRKALHKRRDSRDKGWPVTSQAAV